MNTSDIDLMLAEKGNPCISIVIPTHRYTRDRMQNPALIEKAIQKAKMFLANSAWPKEKIAQLESRFDSVLENVDYIRLQEGLAIFISPNVSQIHLLPFHVKEKVVVGQKFELRDLIYYAQFLNPYFVLALSKKKVRLFKGTGRDLQEVTNNDFPRPYVEEFEYERPAIASSASQGLKAFERDKSIVQEMRTKHFFKDADETLNRYLKDDTRLFVAGVQEELANFQSISQHLGNVAGRIEGNYDFDAIHPLAEIAWKKMKEDIHDSHNQLLVKAKEDIGRNMMAEGIVNVWRAAALGLGLTLLLEKDYQVLAYYHPENDAEIHLTPPATRHEILPNAADALIDIVREKGGKIVILENGELEAFGHVALLLRYPA